MSKYIGLGLVACVLATLFYFTNNTTISIGRLINVYFPCKQDPITSYPCYGGYDVGFMFIFGVLFALSIAVIIFDLIKTIIRNSTRAKGQFK